MESTAQKIESVAQAAAQEAGQDWKTCTEADRNTWRKFATLFAEVFYDRKKGG